MSWWQTIKNYYSAIGEKYEVDPVLFVGIHIVATPLFALAVAWIIYNRKHKRPILMPVVTATFIFNAANIYLILIGKNIPGYIYALVGTTALVTGYFTFKKVRKKLNDINRDEFH